MGVMNRIKGIGGLKRKGRIIVYGTGYQGAEFKIKKIKRQAGEIANAIRQEKTGNSEIKAMTYWLRKFFSTNEKGKDLEVKKRVELILSNVCLGKHSGKDADFLDGEFQDFCSEVFDRDMKKLGKEAGLRSGILS